jgi:hypothetical protein
LSLAAKTLRGFAFTFASNE